MWNQSIARAAAAGGLQAKLLSSSPFEDHCTITLAHGEESATIECFLSSFS
jgi:hypothetical protein